VYCHWLHFSIAKPSLPPVCTPNTGRYLTYNSDACHSLKTRRIPFCRGNLKTPCHTLRILHTPFFLSTSLIPSPGHSAHDTPTLLRKVRVVGKCTPPLGSTPHLRIVLPSVLFRAGGVLSGLSPDWPMSGSIPPNQ